MLPLLSRNDGSAPRMDGGRAGRPDLLATTARLAMAVIVVGALYVGRDLFIALTLAALITFVLAAPVSRMRLLVGLGPAIAAAVLAAILIVVAVLAVLAWQVGDLAGKLPQYQANLQGKIDALHKLGPEGGALDRIVASLRALGHGVTASGGSRAVVSPPLMVEIDAGPVGSLDAIRSFLAPMVSPLIMAGTVTILVVFMLLERHALRDRLIRLMSYGDISRTTTVVNDAADRVGRFLRIQIAINTGFGLTVAAALWAVGMPNAAIWGLLAAALRFIPYMGSLIAALLPAIVAVAVDPGWTLPVAVVAIIVGLEVIIGQLVEPRLYGASTGTSALAIVVSAIFWGLLWGAPGLLLATPITVCLAVLGRHVSGFRFLDILLGTEAVLSLDARLYQRLLAHSRIDAVEIAVETATEQGVRALYGTVLIPMLSFAEADRARGSLSETEQQAIADGVVAMIQAVTELPETTDAEVPQVRDGRTDVPADMAHGDGHVLCLGVRGGLDVAAAEIVADLLRRRHVAATVASFGQAINRPGEGAAAGAETDVLAVFVGIPSRPMIEHVVRRSEARFGDGAVIGLGLFSDGMAAPEATRDSTLERVIATDPVALADQVGRHVRLAPPEKAAA